MSNQEGHPESAPPWFPVAPGAAPPSVPPVAGVSMSSGGVDVVRRPRWVAPMLVAMFVVTIAAVAFGSWTLARTGWHRAGSDQSALLAAHNACDHKGELSDGNATLYLDLQGDDAGSGTLTYTDLQCYYRELHIPDYVTKHMEATRALDGRQSDTWSVFEASWSYHPDHGLDVLIRQIH